MTNELARIRADTITQVLRQLEIAQRLIAARLAREPGDSLSRQRLTNLKNDIDRHLTAFRTGATAAAATGSAAAMSAGIADITRPLAAAGLDFTPRINERQLLSMRVALTDLISDITTVTRNRINTQLGQVLIGTQPLSTAVTRVQQLMGGAARNRARTIVYTEIGRINSAAAQASMEDATQRLPGLKKRWVHSDKKHPRRDHIQAHGQVRPVNEAFNVGGEKLMYPRDPAGSARNTINCGCRHIPVVDGSGWGKSTVRMDVQNPTGTLSLQPTSAPGDAVTRTPVAAAGGAAATVVQQTGGALGAAQTAAALWEKRASRGLPEPLAAALVTLERDLAERPVEWVVVLDLAGRTLFTQKGQRDRVRTEGLSTTVTRGQVLTHNHPQGGVPTLEDLYMAAGYDFAELRAVATDKRWRLLPPSGGWRTADLYLQESDVMRSVRARLQRERLSDAEYHRRAAAAILDELVRRNLVRVETHAP